MLSNIELIKIKNCSGITSQGHPCTVTAEFSCCKDSVWSCTAKFNEENFKFKMEGSSGIESEKLAL